MTLQAERNLRLTLSAEENHFFEIPVGMRIAVIRLGPQNHFSSLPQNRSRFDLIHEAVLAQKSIAHEASHIGILLSPIFLARQEIVLWVVADVLLQKSEWPNGKLLSTIGHSQDLDQSTLVVVFVVVILMLA